MRAQFLLCHSGIMLAFDVMFVRKFLSEIPEKVSESLKSQAEVDNDT